jgi:hypothetical protein
LGRSYAASEPTIVTKKMDGQARSEPKLLIDRPTQPTTATRGP